MKVMICQPMNGRKDNEILAERNLIIAELSKYKEVILLDTFFITEESNPVKLLAKSIEKLAEADLVVFAPGWEQARGCKIEFEVAKNYGKTILIL